MFVNFNILNQLGSPAINSNTFANRPAAGQTGRLFVSNDTFEIYRDNGTTWDLIGGPGSSTITGTGTATQVAYFISSQAIGSSSNLYWDNTNIRLGIGTATPGTRLDIHGSNVMAQFNGTTSASNSYIAFQRTGSNVWRLGDNYNSGDNYFELRNSVLSNDALTIQATTNKAAFLAQQTYLGGQAQGALFTYNLTAPAGTTFATPNALSAVNAYLNLSLGGNATLPAGTRQGIEGNSRVSFTGAGTLTMSQGSTLRAYAAITGVHSFAGSAVGTITHLAGIRLCFPDNIGSAINIINNYGLLINDQSAGTGTITYTNRWGIYQEGINDTNYLAANLLIGSTIDNGAALQITGNGNLSGDFGIGTFAPAQKLDVYGNAIVRGNFLLNTNGQQIIFSTFYDLDGDGKNIFIGNGGLLSENDGSALYFGSYNTSLGVDALLSNLSGYKNIAIGNNALYTNTTGFENIAIGVNALNANDYGYQNVAIGLDALLSNISGGENIAIGSFVLRDNTSGYYNVALGSYALYRCINGGDNVAIGANSLENNTSGSFNMALGSLALQSCIDGVENTAVGPSALRGITSGSGNVGVGNNTLGNNSLGVYNIAIGFQALGSSNAGDYNTAIGYRAGLSNSGIENVIIGAQAQDQTSNNCVIIGVGANANSLGTQTNEIVIGYNALGEGDNTVKLGNINITKVKTSGAYESGDPNGGTAAAWKLGSVVAATVVLDTTQYIELDVNGTLYKLAIVN